MKPIIKSLVPTNYWFPVLLTEDKFKYGGMLPIKMVNLRSTSPAATGTGYCDASGNSTHPDFLKFLTLSGTSVNPGKSTVNYAFMKNNFAGTTASDVFYASAVSATVPAGALRNALLAKDGETTEYRNVSSFNGKSWKLRSDAPVLGYEKNAVSPKDFEGYKNSIVSRGVTNNPEEHLGIEGGQTCVANIRCEVTPIISLKDEVVCETGTGQVTLTAELTKNVRCIETYPLECCKDINSLNIDSLAGLPPNVATGVDSDGNAFIGETANKINTCDRQSAHHLTVFSPGETSHRLFLEKEALWSKNNIVEIDRLPEEPCCAEVTPITIRAKITVYANYENFQQVGYASGIFEHYVNGVGGEVQIPQDLSDLIVPNVTDVLTFPYDLYCTIQQASLGAIMRARKDTIEKAKVLINYLDGVLVLNCLPPISGCCNIPLCSVPSQQTPPITRPPRRQGSVGQQGGQGL